MELIAKCEGLKLIKKYGQYYIRFVGGQYEEYPCDFRITNKEALTIISQNDKLKTVRDAYKKQVKWTKDFFVDSGEIHKHLWQEILRKLLQVSQEEFNSKI